MKNQDSKIQAFLESLGDVRIAALFVFHAVVFVAAYAFSYLLRFEFSIPAEYLPTFRSSLLVVVGVQLAMGALFGFYRGWWRYVGLADVVRLVLGLTTATTILLALWYTGEFLGVEARFTRSPRGVLLTDWAFSLLTLFGARVVIRLGRDRLRPVGRNATIRRVLIIGAGDAGETLAREIEHRPQLAMKVVAFVDDNRAKWGSHIRGIRIYGPISALDDLLHSLRPDEALIAIPSASGKRIREIIVHLSSAGIPFKTIPGIDRLVTGRVHVAQLRPVNVEDLLSRKRIDLPGDPVRQLFAGKRVLVTGAGGTIGSELASQILQFEPSTLALVERSEYALYEVHKRLNRETPWAAKKVTSHLADIRNTEEMSGILEQHRPQIVVHAAAHKHVPLGEENPREYLRNNTLATNDLATLCRDSGVERFVFISTDKAINPTSIMGATKRAAEVLLLDVARDGAMTLTIVRFGNVIGSSGSVIPLFMEQIAAGGPITVTHPEVTRYFIRTSEAVSLVLQAATLGSGGSVFMLDMGEPIRIADLAHALIRLSNHAEDDIPIVFTGLRPGEKLFEEIRLEGESIHPTVHPQIVITESPQPDRDVVRAFLRDGESAVRPRAVAMLLRTLVPEYQTPAESEPRLATADGKLSLAVLPPRRVVDRH